MFITLFYKVYTCLLQYLMYISYIYFCDIKYKRTNRRFIYVITPKIIIRYKL